jgi:hypothetical protein
MEAFMFLLYLKRIAILLTIFLPLLFVLSCSEDSPSEPNQTNQTITVSGFVKDSDGEPVAGVPVIIKGKAPVTTNANGAFTVSSVSKPYEARVIFSTDQAAIVYQGLTRSDPTLIYLGVSSNYKIATITGSVPPAAGKVTKVFFTSGTMAWSTEADEVTGSYILSVDWKGTFNSVSGTLRVLRWTQGISGIPTLYDAYGIKENITISDGGNFPNNNFAVTDLTDPPEQNISGSIVRPSTSYVLSYRALNLFLGGAMIYLGHEWGPGLSDNFSYVVPSIAGATFGVEASASLNATPTSRYTMYSKIGITGGSSGITVNLASAPQLNIPANNGSGIDTTTQFLWTMGSGGGICLLLISPTFINGPTYYIFTASSSSSIPNLAPQGLGLPSNVSYTWQVSQVFPVSSINDAASSTFFQQTSGSAEGGQANSEQFTFTTKTNP